MDGAKYKRRPRHIVIRSLIPFAEVVWDAFDHISFVVMMHPRQGRNKKIRHQCVLSEALLQVANDFVLPISTVGTAYKCILVLETFLFS